MEECFLCGQSQFKANTHGEFPREVLAEQFMVAGVMAQWKRRHKDQIATHSSKLRRVHRGSRPEGQEKVSLG